MTMTETTATNNTNHFSNYERRRFGRVQLGNGLTALLGRIEGMVVDLSARGARVRHSTPLPGGGAIRLTIECGNEQISATARVVSSRLVCLGRGAASNPLYESRLALVEVPHISEYFLARFLSRMGASETRAAVNQ
jgi:hypothetical protein